MENTTGAILDNQHWTFENYRQRVTRKQAQNFLLTVPTIVFNGEVYDLKAKHIGAGVYEVYKEKRVK